MINFKTFLFKRSSGKSLNSVENAEPVSEDNREIVDVTIILNIWRRKYLNEQLASLAGQSVRPKSIWIIQYENHIISQEVIDRYKALFVELVTIRSEKNLKYFGRFSIAINVDTKYTWLVDDDVIPGSEWLERCVNKCESLNSIISCTGRIIPKDNCRPEERTATGYQGIYYGDLIPGRLRNYMEEDTRVDYACNSYFFKSEWISAYWSVWPKTFLSGEDIHLCATLKSALDVGTTVLKQVGESDSGNIKRPYGWDRNASWRGSDFIDLREEIIRYHIEEHNWRPLNWLAECSGTVGDENVISIERTPTA